MHVKRWDLIGLYQRYIRWREQLVGIATPRKASMTTNPAKDLIFYLQKCRFGCWQLGPDLQLWYQSSSSTKIIATCEPVNFQLGVKLPFAKRSVFRRIFGACNRGAMASTKTQVAWLWQPKMRALGQQIPRIPSTKLVRQSFGYHLRIVAIANSGCAPTKNWIQSK